jgi:Family of unknown function (DUF6524)
MATRLAWFAPHRPLRPLRKAIGLALGSKLAARLMIAALLVFGTYNPTGPCWLRWLRDGAADPVWKIVVSGLVAVAWGVVLPVSVRALGFGGIALATVLATSAIWALAAAGVIGLAGPDADAWVLLSVGAFVLGIGLCWIILAIALDGQVRLRDLTR